ncbi:hypothetical protein Pmani_034599 [Petrolisthes manimaculis]|uniref:Uncharacterized protein n=2 Tax=Petrolisthes TaxID=84661 RepID=A0AAE1NM45_9EUCA|nr:hypothetical protein Pmani_034599 [Petrolisthes manimaculis]
MTLKLCNLQGVTDALFREFMSQPGERQWCSEILHSITKGERIDTKELLRLPSDTFPLKGSPKASRTNTLFSALANEARPNTITTPTTSIIRRHPRRKVSVDGI